jgi:integrase
VSAAVSIQPPSPWLRGPWAVDGVRADTTVRHLTVAVRPLAATLEGKAWTDLDCRLAERYAQTAALGHLRAASLACKRAVDDGLLVTNPFDGVVPRWEHAVDFRYVDATEMERLIAALHDTAGLHGTVLACAFTLLRYEPVSVYEALTLRWSDVDAERGELRIAVHSAKVAEASLFDVDAWRTVPLDHRAQAAIEPLSWHPEPLLLTGRYGGALTRRALGHRFEVARTRAGLDGLQFRDFRHSHVADLCTDRVPRQEIRRRLGLSAHWRELVALHRSRLAAGASRASTAEQLRFELDEDE